MFSVIVGSFLVFLATTMAYSFSRGLFDKVYCGFTTGILVAALLDPWLSMSTGILITIFSMFISAKIGDDL